MAEISFETVVVVGYGIEVAKTYSDNLIIRDRVTGQEIIIQRADVDDFVKAVRVVRKVRRD